MGQEKEGHRTNNDEGAGAEAGRRRLQSDVEKGGGPDSLLMTFQTAISQHENIRVRQRLSRDDNSCGSFLIIIFKCKSSGENSQQEGCKNKIKK